MLKCSYKKTYRNEYIMIETKEVTVEVINHIGIIKLNRKNALNALSLVMIEKISHYISLWENDPMIYAIYIKSILDNVFCAGGDAKSLYLNDEKYKDEYLAKQYLMDYHLHTYKKPVISFLDGITFGGGVGLGLSASHVIVSKKVRFAMPETKIGFFPDVGTSRLLNDLPYHIGYYLGLLGIELDYKDLHYLNLVKYVIDSNLQEDFEKDLYTNRFNQATVVTQIDEVLLKYQLEHIDESYLKGIEHNIDSIFSKSTINKMYDALGHNDWEQEVKNIFDAQSPTALYVTLELLKQTRDKNLYDCFKMEHDLSKNVTKTHDFKEGVRSLLIDKDKRFLYQPKHILDVDHRSIEKLFDFSNFEKLHLMDKLRGF